MGFKTLVLGTASLLALTGVATAQTTPPPATTTTPLDTTAGTPAGPSTIAPQTGPAVETAAADDADDTIVVTGLRRSLQSAQGIKRNSVQIVDSIVAEDIGKLPDIAVSDTAARIPGVQVDRLGGEASNVLVRGLPDFSTTYNGREIFTAETRVVALQDFPSSNIAALEVFKATSANLVEAGLAGLINVRSRRPFDFPGLEVGGSAWGLYTRQAGEFNPNGNFLVSNRWETGAGEFGLLVNASYTEIDYLDSEPSNTDFIADPFINGQVVRFPDIQRLFYRSGNRVRPSVNIAAQWKPNPDLEFYAEGLFQGFRNKISDRNLEVPLYGGSAFTNLVFRPGTNVLSSGTVANSPGAIFSFQGGTYNKTDTYQYAVGAIWNTGPLRLTLDLARTDSTFTGSTESVDRTITGGRTVDFDLETPQFTILDFDAANPANYLFDGLFEQAQQAKGDDIQARLDAEYETGFDWLPKIQAGVRYTDRDAHREFGDRFAGFRGRGIPISALPLDFELFRAGFRGTDVQSVTNTFLAPTYDSIRENRAALRRYVISQGATNFTEEDVLPDPRQTFDGKEKTLAGYLQLNYAYGDIIDGVVGVRAVRTKTAIDGTSLVPQADPDGPGPLPAPPSVFTPVSANQKYTDWLPNVSMRVRFTPELQLRLSATQTRTRPTFGQLNPSSVLSPPQSQCTPTSDPFSCARTGDGGNPALRPFTSNNYDASLEYYFAPAGFVSGTVFRRDLEGFIQTLQTRRIDPVLGPLILNAPVNSGKGRIDGFEAQVQGFFDYDFLPEFARGFGAAANVTYVDAETGFPDGTGNVILVPILGVSKWTYNLAAFYERNGISARLSYNKRGKFPDTIQNRGDDLYTQQGVPAGRLDLSTSYAFSDKFTVFFDWTNILNDAFRVDLSSARNGAPRADYVRFLRFEETTFSLGVRVRL